MKERIFFICMGILTIIWGVAIVTLPVSATLYFLNNL